jgi:TonB family protein
LSAVKSRVLLLAAAVLVAQTSGLAQVEGSDPNRHPYPWVSTTEIHKRLVRQPRPSYPPLAKQARIQGNVRLQAVIDKTGKVSDVRALSGHPLLIQPAIDAVKQWEFKPFEQKGKPVAVQTYLDVQFHLDK